MTIITASMHSLDFHKHCLRNLCSNRAQTCEQINHKATPKLCANSRNEIYIYYGVHISSDEEEIHPTKICNKCFYKMKNANVLSENNKMDRDKYLGEKEKAGSASRLWKPHKCIDCNVCKLYTDQMRKGRAKKSLKEADQKKKLQLAKMMAMF